MTLVPLLLLGCRAPAFPELRHPERSLHIRELSVSSSVALPLASTQFHVVVENPTDYSLETLLSIPIAPGAVITRVAHGFDSGASRRSSVIPRSERFGATPRLSENAGDRVTVQPRRLGPGEEAELLIEMVHPVGAVWRLPLGELPPLERFTIDVGDYQQTLKDVEPVGAVQLPVGSRAAGVRAGGMVAAWLPESEGVPASVDGLTVLVDTSGGQAETFSRDLGRLRETITLLAEDEPSLPVQVFAFDQDVVAVYQGPASGYPAADAALRERGALGLGDLSGAAEHLSGMVLHERVLLATDGIFPLGAPPGLSTALGVARVDVLETGPTSDADVLSALAAGGRVIHSEQAIEDAVQALSLSVPELGAISVPGSIWSSEGAEGVVYAYLEAPADTLTIHRGEEALTVPLVEADAQALQPLLVAARVAQLEQLAAQAPSRREGIHRHIETLVLSLGILSAHGDLSGGRTVCQGGVCEPVSDAGPLLTPELLLREEEPAPAPLWRIPPSATLCYGTSSAPDRVLIDFHHADRGAVFTRHSLQGLGGSGGTSGYPGLFIDSPQAAFPWRGPYGDVQRLLRAGEAARALRLAEAWRAAVPDQPEPLVAMGQVLEAQGRPAVAARAYGALAELAPSQPGYMVGAGIGLEQTGQSALVKRVYQRLIETRPFEPEGYRRLAWVLAEEGQTAAAISLLEAGIEQAWEHEQHASNARLRFEREFLMSETTAPVIYLHLGWAGSSSLQLVAFDRQGPLYVDRASRRAGVQRLVLLEEQGPYTVQARTQQLAPRGTELGWLDIVRRDDEGITVEHVPLVVSRDRAWIDLGHLPTGDSLKGLSRRRAHP